MKPDTKRSDIVQRAAKVPAKIDRSAFLYMVDHDGDAADFAQCIGCMFFKTTDAKGSGKCATLGIDVKASWSCGLFIDGHYEGTAIKKHVTPEEAGVYKGSVRCENCKFGGKTCGLYDRLNKELPALFDLDSKIEPKGCCNGFKPK